MRNYFLTPLLLLVSVISFAQKVSEIDPKFVKLPRYADLTVIQTAISSPTQAMMVYNEGTASNWYYDGSSWKNMNGASGGGILTLPFSQTQSDPSSLFSITNSGTGTAAFFQGQKALETNGGVKMAGTNMGTPKAGKQLTSIDSQGNAQWKDLVPKLSVEEIDLLPSPQLGDLAYDLTFRCLKQYNGTKWLCTYQSSENPTSNMTAKREGGSGYDFGSKVATDNNGDTYLAGGFNGSFTIGLGTENATVLHSVITSPFYYDGLLAKYNASGQLLWAKQTISNPTSFVYFNDIAVDANGNSFVTGVFEGSVIFGAGSENSQTLTSTKQEIFLAKYDINGNLLWIRQTTGTGSSVYNEASGIVLDSNGDVFITGTFNNTTFFESSSVFSSGFGDIFIAKYLANGNLAFVVKAGGTNGEASRDIAIDASNMVYITGSFNSTNCYFTGITIVNNNNFSDVFVAKMTPSGVWVWASKGGGFGADVGQALKVNSTGDLFVTGEYKSVASFGSYYLEAGQNGDIFISRVNAATGDFYWAFKIYGTSQKYVRDMAIDAESNFYITGSYKDEIKFTPFSLYFPSITEDAMYVAKYTKYGACRWVKTTDTESFGSGVTVSQSGNIFATGSFSGTGVFGPTTLVSSGGQDLFIARLKE